MKHHDHRGEADDYVDSDVLNAARAAVPPAAKRAAFLASLNDTRDTATPRAMARFLARLAAGRILSPASTELLLGIMARTRTFPTRLRAGVGPGWRVAHKTGTSGDFGGLNGVTNDVGLLLAPDGRTIAVAVFLAQSRAPARDRDAVIASVARAASGDTEKP